MYRIGCEQGTVSVEVLHVALGGVEELVASLLERMDDRVVNVRDDNPSLGQSIAEVGVFVAHAHLCGEAFLEKDVTRYQEAHTDESICRRLLSLGEAAGLDFVPILIAQKSVAGGALGRIAEAPYHYPLGMRCLQVVHDEALGGGHCVGVNDEKLVSLGLLR